MPTPVAAAHALALALQGVVAAWLLGWSGAPAALLVAGFALAGIALAFTWSRWEAIPHRLDMAFGMLTMGNLGMLLGWWGDNGFAPLQGGGCACCAAAVTEGALGSGMWLGMLLLANVAMFAMARRRHPGVRFHRSAMLTGGNAGMVLGMIAGAWAAGGVQAESVPVAAAATFAGMTAGMIAGMTAGAELTRRLVAAAAALRTLPRWLLRG